MNGPEWLRRIALGVAIGALLAVSVFPSTRRLVRQQFAILNPLASSHGPWEIASDTDSPMVRNQALLKLQETASRSPNDYLLQFADALMVEETGDEADAAKLSRLRGLAGRFPGRPGLYGAILRISTRRQVRIERAEVSLLYVPDSRSKRSTPGETTRRLQDSKLSIFLREAGEGERLDPTNAFFPAMIAVGCFAGHRDAEALEALQRASVLRRCNEYLEDELLGERELFDRSFPDYGALQHMALAESLTYPHLAQMRAASRVAVALASTEEKDGHIGRGLAIRESVRRCGALLRVQSLSSIGSLVGIAISAASLERPGGVPLLTKPGVIDRSGLPGRAAEFDNYLRLHRLTSKIPAFNAEARIGVQVREIFRQSIRTEIQQEPESLAKSWIWDLALLCAAEWMLLLAILSGLWKKYQANRSLAGGLFIASLLFCGLSAFQFMASLEPMVRLFWMPSSENPGFNMTRVKFAVFGLSALMPLALLMAAAIVSLVRRKGFATAFVETVRTGALLGACALVAIYAVSLPATLRHERAVDFLLGQMTNHEGRFMAETVGRAWPGFIE